MSDLRSEETETASEFALAVSPFAVPQPKNANAAAAEGMNDGETGVQRTNCALLISIEQTKGLEFDAVVLFGDGFHG